MNKLILLLNIIGLFLILNSCKKTSTNVLDFNQETFVSANKLTIEGLQLMDPIQLLIKDSILIILENSSENLIKIIDLKRLTIINQFGKIGGGPEEYGSIGNAWFDVNDSNTLEVLDVQKQKIYIYNLNDIINNSFSPIKTILINKGTNKRIIFLDMIKTSKSYLGTGIFDEGKFSILNHNGQFEESFQNYKNIDDFNLNNYNLGTIYQGRLTHNSKLRKFAFAVSAAPQLELYKYDQNTITSVKIINHKEPLIQKNGHIVALKANNPFAFIDITSDNKNIYVSYSGKTFLEDDVKADWCNHLLIYDWNGNPEIQIDLDCNIKNICCDTIWNKVLCISYNPFPQLVSIEIPEF